MNLHAATVPVFTSCLRQLDKGLDKAVAFADHKKFDPEILLQSRLAPDQYPYLRQVQAACDQMKFTVAKLTGKTPPVHPDTETTIAALRARIATVAAYLATFKPADFEGAEDRRCTASWMGDRSMRGGDYLDHFALPNLHFHLTLAYAVLRHNGVPLGKLDYIGELPWT